MVWIIICKFSLFLQGHELFGEVEYRLREVSGIPLEVLAPGFGVAMLESSVDMAPCPLTSSGGRCSDELVGAAAG